MPSHFTGLAIGGARHDLAELLCRLLEACVPPVLGCARINPPPLNRAGDFSCPLLFGEGY